MKLRRFRLRLKNPTLLLVGLTICLLVFGLSPADAANATSASTGSLPWDGPLTTLSNDVSGPVAFTISLMGIIAGGAALLWGGEINEWMRRMIYLVMVVSVIVFGKNLLQGTMFSGAMVPAGGLQIAMTVSPASSIKLLFGLA